jgi:methylated-DNA-[protein]-cysteine S-methyltransferase
MAGASTVWFLRMQSPVGPLLLAAGENGLRCLQFDGGGLPRAERDEVWVQSRAALRPYAQQLRAYFRGELREFTCKLDLQGTAFQVCCWEALRAIPYGTTCSYGDIARKVGRPLAVRAVGQANHRNPIAIIVPCHRVVGSGGSLTGYGGGLEVKEKLLRLASCCSRRSVFTARGRSAPICAVRNEVGCRCRSPGCRWNR